MVLVKVKQCKIAVGRIVVSGRGREGVDNSELKGVLTCDIHSSRTKGALHYMTRCNCVHQKLTGYYFHSHGQQWEMREIVALLLSVYSATN